MGVEVRNGRLYLYARVRVKGRLHSRYCGPISPERAVEFQLNRAAERALRLNEKHLAQAAGQQAAVVAAAAAEFDRLADHLFRGTMYLNGFHLHHRSEWRKQKGEVTMPPDADLVPRPPETDLVPQTPVPSHVSPIAAAKQNPKRAMLVPMSDDPAIQKTLDQAASGDPGALPAIRQLLTNPLYLKMLGDVADIARDRLLGAIAGDNLAVAEAVRQEANDMQGNLMADTLSTGSFVEQLAAVRVVHNWLALHRLEATWASQPVGTDGAEAVARQVAQVEKRCEASLKALATLRRLCRPALAAQVNVAAGPMIVNNAPAATMVTGERAGGTETSKPRRSIVVRIAAVDAAFSNAIPDRQPGPACVQ